ncbi:MAG TPA: DUF1501 domain-containing protein [Verrucomicrobiota bacterium]|nr:DUF1501 domain-containing protein [Verrucomicrobiota bacterium]
MSHNRRQFLYHSMHGFSGVALAAMLADEVRGASPEIDPARPYASRQPHFTPRATSVIEIFCAGALSHVDTFDYKPELIRRHGQPLPGNEKLVSFQGPNGNLTRPLWQFRPRGQCEKMVSDLVPHIGAMVDDISFLHSLTNTSNTHGPAENVLNTGFAFDGFPSMGAWVNYALGSENQNLPAFVAIEDPRGMPQSGPNNWASGFLPAAFQGTPFSSTKPVRFLQRPGDLSAACDAAARAALLALEKQNQADFPDDAELAARVASYELAARMQLTVPEAANLKAEPAHIRSLYGADSANKHKAGFASNCILARRLVERGVRFVQLFNGAYASGGNINWDGHSRLKEQYDVHGEILDQPVGGLLLDLKQRGLLENTLVVFATEFGRMPMFQAGTFGRDHNPKGFTAWLAGAGVKGGISHGATDEFGFRAQEDVITPNDFHATILHLLGLDHEKLTYYHDGVQRRLTNVSGQPIKRIMA